MDSKAAATSLSNFNRGFFKRAYIESSDEAYHTVKPSMISPDLSGKSFLKFMDVVNYMRENGPREESEARELYPNEIFPEVSSIG